MAPDIDGPSQVASAAKDQSSRQRWRSAIIASGSLAGLILGLTAWLLLAQPSGYSVDQDIQRAQTARTQGQSELARRYFEAALIQAPEQLEARVGLATMLYEMGDWDQAWDLATVPTTPTSSGARARDQAVLDLIAGEIALGRGRLDLAEERFAAVREGAGQGFTPVVHAAALNGLSHVYADQGMIMEYLAIRAEAVDPLLVSAQVEAFAEGLLSAGTMVHPSFDESWSLPRLQRALSVFEEIGDAGGIARTHTALGANLALDDATRARHFQTALALYRSAEHRPGELAVLIHLASFEIGRLNADAAQMHVARGLELSNALNAPRFHADFSYRNGLARMASTVGAGIEVRDEQLEAATTALERAAAEYAALGIVLDGLAPRFHAAIAWFDAGDATRALAAFEQLVQVYRDLPFPPGELGARLGQAAALSKLGRHEQAEHVLEDIEQARPGAIPVTTAIRNAFIEEQSGASSRSLFEIIITAERMLTDVGRFSD
ncbi:MAG: tetratricopeptide repeat protein [Pseudomonadota bacterium]